MALEVLVGHVQDRSGVHAAAYEDEIDRLIVRLLPVVEFALRLEAVASTDEGLLAVLNDGAAEVIAGEFLSQHYRRPELLISVIVGDLQLFPRRFDNPRDPSGMIASGWQKLWPWLKVDLAVGITTSVLAATGKGGNPDERLD